MILQNKKSGRRVSLTRDQFDRLKELGFARSWIVIDSRDETVTIPAKSLPKEIIEFTKVEKKPKKKKNGNK